MTTVRRIGAVVFAAVAVLLWFVLAPAGAGSHNHDFAPAISAALTDFDKNNATAESAPQQAVVNGWAAKDLLTVMAQEQNTALQPASAPRDNRVPGELALLVVAVAFFGAISGARRPVPMNLLAPRTTGRQAAREEVEGVIGAFESGQLTEAAFEQQIDAIAARNAIAREDVLDMIGPGDEHS